MYYTADNSKSVSKCLLKYQNISLYLIWDTAKKKHFITPYYGIYCSVEMFFLMLISFINVLINSIYLSFLPYVVCPGLLFLLPILATTLMNSIHSEVGSKEEKKTVSVFQYIFRYLYFIWLFIFLTTFYLSSLHQLSSWCV